MPVYRYHRDKDMTRAHTAGGLSGFFACFLVLRGGLSATIVVWPINVGLTATVLAKLFFVLYCFHLSFIPSARFARASEAIEDFGAFKVCEIILENRMRAKLYVFLGISLTAVRLTVICVCVCLSVCGVSGT
jgi:hypothetical protein